MPDSSESRIPSGLSERHGACKAWICWLLRKGASEPSWRKAHAALDRSGGPALRVGAPQALWRDRADRVLPDRGARSHGPRGDPLRLRRLAHERAPDPRLPSIPETRPSLQGSARAPHDPARARPAGVAAIRSDPCLLYTSDAADE